MFSGKVVSCRLWGCGSKSCVILMNDCQFYCACVFFVRLYLHSEFFGDKKMKKKKKKRNHLHIWCFPVRLCTKGHTAATPGSLQVCIVAVLFSTENLTHSSHTWQTCAYICMLCKHGFIHPLAPHTQTNPHTCMHKHIPKSTQNTWTQHTHSHTYSPCVFFHPFFFHATLWESRDSTLQLLCGEGGVVGYWEGITMCDTTSVSTRSEFEIKRTPPFSTSILSSPPLSRPITSPPSSPLPPSIFSDMIPFQLLSSVQPPPTLPSSSFSIFFPLLLLSFSFFSVQSVSNLSFVYYDVWVR